MQKKWNFMIYRISVRKEPALYETSGLYFGDISQNEAKIYP